MQDKTIEVYLDSDISTKCNANYSAIARMLSILYNETNYTLVRFYHYQVIINRGKGFIALYYKDSGSISTENIHEVGIKNAMINLRKNIRKSIMSSSIPGDIKEFVFT